MKVADGCRTKTASLVNLKRCVAAKNSRGCSSWAVHHCEATLVSARRTRSASSSVTRQYVRCLAGMSSSTFQAPLAQPQAQHWQRLHSRVKVSSRGHSCIKKPSEHSRSQRHCGRRGTEPAIVPRSSAASPISHALLPRLALPFCHCSSTLPEAAQLRLRLRGSQRGN
jgi:hypothetical protein